MATYDPFHMTSTVVVRPGGRVASVTRPLTSKACRPKLITTVTGPASLNATIEARAASFEFAIYHVTWTDRYEVLALSSYPLAVVGRTGWADLRMRLQEPVCLVQKDPSQPCR